VFQDYKIAYVREHVKINEVKRLSFLRLCDAYVLSQSARTIPHAAMVSTFDVTPLIEYTRGNGEKTENSGDASSEKDLLKRALRKNYSAFFLKTLAHSLYHTPTINGFLDYRRWRSGGTMYIAEDINISFTVGTKHGVIKPIIRNPHLKDIGTVANEMRILSRRARRTDPNELYRQVAKAYIKTALKQFNIKELYGMWMLLRALLWQKDKPDPSLIKVPEDQKLQASDILGATCTLANIGMAVPGNQTVTVITPPEVMMVGIGDLHLAPMVVDGKVLPRHTITLF